MFSFSTSGDAEPVAGLTLGKRGALYGTALFSSVFELSPTSSGYVLLILHALRNPGGSLPYAPVIAGSGGALYGTTYEGGATSRCKTHFGCGTVYELTRKRSGYRETVFSFQHGDGAYPLVALLLGNDGTLYGTTERRWSRDVPRPRKEIWLRPRFQAPARRFGLQQNGAPSRFAGGTDGATPSSPLIADASGALYGTTGGGGGSSGCQGGCGIVFKI